MIKTITRCRYCKHGKWSNEECRNEYCKGYDIIAEIRRERGVIASVEIEQTPEPPAIDYKYQVCHTPIAAKVYIRIEREFKDKGLAMKAAYYLAKGQSGTYMKGHGLYPYKKTRDLQKELRIIR